MPATRKSGTLEQFCTNMTVCMQAGEIDPVIGRELKIRTMIDVLLCHQQNNPLNLEECTDVGI